MAGYWKLVYYWDEASGRKQSMRVWVSTDAAAESARRRSRKRAAALSARARARAQAVAARQRQRALAETSRLEAERAARSAAQRDRQRRVAEARRRAFDNLQRRQAALLRDRGLVRDLPKREKYIAEREATLVSNAERRRIQTQNTQRAQAGEAAAERQRQLTAYEKRRLAQRLGGDRRAGGGGGTRGPLTPEEASALERVLAEESRRAREGKYDTENVERFRQAYDKYATKVYDDYEAAVAKVNAAIDAGDIDKARRLYENLKKLVPEFQRLFGTGRDALKDGAYLQFYQNYQNIGLSQREWWKRQMRASLERTVESARRSTRHSRDDLSVAGESAQELLDILDGKIKTRRVADGVDQKTGKTRYRYLSPEEEIARRQAERIMQSEKLRAQFGLQQFRIRSQMASLGLTEYKGQYIERDLVPIAKQAENVMQKFYDGKFDPARPNDIHNFVDRMLSEWAVQNPEPKITKAEFDRGTNAEWTLWKQRRDAYENSAYRFFGLGPQGILEKGIDTPGIRHALQLLNAPFATVGAGYRGLSQMIFGESKIGGVTPTFGDAPAHVKAGAERAAQDWLKATGPTTGSSRFDPRAGMDRVRQEYYNKWLATAEGRRWLRDTVAERSSESARQFEEFGRTFYDGNNDFWKRLEALNEFGNAPFQSEGASLLAAFLLDPLNVIPLKFTTYGARALYTLEQTKKATGLLGKPVTALKSFLSVDEGKLSLLNYQRNLEKELAQKGMTLDRFTDLLRERVQDVKTAAERQNALRHLFREIGINPKRVNEAELYNLVEYLATEAAGKRGRDLFTEADRLAKEMKAAEKAALKKEQARKALAKSEQDRVAKSLRIRESEAQAARTSERSLKKAAAEQEVTQKAAAERARQAGAAEGVAGPSQPARTPRTVQPHPVAAEVAARAPRRRVRAYAAADELYDLDALGNRLPKGSPLARQKDYQKLVRRAQNGDAVAKVQVARLARRERNRIRTVSQDLSVLDPRARSAWRATAYDIAEASGVDPANAAQVARLNAERRTIRQIKLAAGRRNDAWVESFTRPTQRGERVSFTERNADIIDQSEMDKWIDMDGAPPEHIEIGRDILLARDESARGLHGAYSPFSHDNLRFYPEIPANFSDSIKAMTGAKFKDILKRLSGNTPGIASFRDGGQYIFEVFHQLRLANDLDQLAALTKAVDEVLADDVQNLFAWMWKVMEDRTNLLDDFLWNVDGVTRGFLDAAEVWGLHAELSLGMIPWGYASKTPPLSFGLMPRLANAAESAPWFHVAPFHWTENIAKNEISKIALGSGGASATRVVHFFAETYGDFAQYSVGWARMTDELGWLASHQLGDDFVDAVLRQRDKFPQELLDFAARHGEDVEVSLRKQIAKQLKDFPVGGRSLRTNPEFRGFREAILQAYEKGLLPVRNAEFHKMMMLASLQTKVGHRVADAAVRRYSAYMRQIGKAGDAKQIVYDLFKGEILSDVTQIAREQWRAGRKTVTLSARAQLWHDLGLMPSAAKMKAYAYGRARGEGALEARLAQDLKRDGWLNENAPLHRDAWVGNVDFHDTIANINDILREHRQSPKPELFDEAAGQLRSVIYRMVDKGGNGVAMDSLDELSDLADVLRAMPEGEYLLNSVIRDVGDMVRGERLRLSHEPFALERITLTLKIQTLTGKKGSEAALKAAQDELAVVERTVRELGGPKVKVQYENKDGVIREVEVTPRRSVSLPDDAAGSTASISARAASETAPLSTAETILSKVGRMTEQEWYNHVRAQVHKQLRRKNLSRAKRMEYAKRLRQVDAAELAMKIERGQGSLVHWTMRARFQKRVLRLFGKDAEEYIAPRMIAPRVLSEADAVVEQARTYYRLLQQASPVDAPGANAIRIGGEKVEYMPLQVFRDLDARISDAIAEARGWRANTVTRKRARAVSDDERPLGRMTDNDPLVLRAKEKAVKQYYKDTGNFIPMSAYDEVRQVLWRGHVQNNTALQLLDRARRRAAQGLGGTDVEKIYLALRARRARVEARRQLGRLAYSEMYGVDPSVIFSDFVARYSDDGTIKKFTPNLTGFQRRTLEAQFRELSGVAPTDPGVGVFLQSANRPPLHNRELTRKFLIDTGAWSPRKADDFVRGNRSWSIYEEAEYWKNSFGEVPDWCNVDILSDLDDGAGMIFHDQYRYIEQMKAWGVFSRSQELALRMDGKTAVEIERAVLLGDPELKLPARRSLELQRRFVIERYGRLVSRDGKSLDAMPWLMHPDEHRRYFSRQTLKSLPEGLIQTEAELNEVIGLIERAIDEFWDRYIKADAAAGPIHYQDIFRLASEIQAQLLVNPKWARRWKDVIGTGLNSWAWVNRWLVFSHPAFMIVNVIDAPIKTAWYRFSRRGLFSRTLEGSKHQAAAEALTPQMFNWDATPAIYRSKQLRARERLLSPRGITPIDRVVDRALASVQVTGEVFPEIAGRAELAMRMRLAKGMYSEVYESMLKRFGNEELARAASLDFIKKEVSKMWPTAGDGPLERLWNTFVPFSSYTLRNKVLWISEAISHPVVLVHLERIGAAIERYNIEQWEADPANHGQPMPENLRRLIELPWAKGYYIDLSQFTDASRGLQPLYDSGWKSNQQRFGDWIRYVSPAQQAALGALFNAFNLFPRTAWQLGEDGQYRLITVPWLEPWSKEAATLGSVFWFVDAVETGLRYGIKGWDSGEVSAFVGQLLFFNAIKTYDRMGVTYGWYKGLSSADRKTFLATPEGHALMEWLAERSRLSAFKGDLLTMMAQHDADPGKWWFVHQPDDWKKRVSEGRGKIKSIRDAFAVELYRLQPGTAAYRETKARMYLAISDVYTQYPELMEDEVFSKTASEWAEQLADWQTDKLMDDFMALSRQRPRRADFDSNAAFTAATANWERQKRLFLNTFPQVRDRLASEITEVESARQAIEAQWNEVLGRIEKRNTAIEAAKAVLAESGRDSKEGRAAQSRLDLLYLQNDLDYTLLERDYAAAYFSPDDYNRLPDGSLGDLKQPGLLKRATTFIDFDRAVYERNLREGTLEEYLAKGLYGQSMREAMLYAKGGDPFGKFDPAKWLKYMNDSPSLLEKYFKNNPEKKLEWANAARYVEGIRALWKQAGNDPAKWVRLLKQDKWLLQQYFSRNPGKEKEWARMDAYIRYISVWGKLVSRQRWDDANKVWDTLPQWVKDEYYRKHPERRKRAQQTAEYLGYMQRWVNLFEKGKNDEAMKYFRSLPKWAQERYYKAHPENRLRFELSNSQTTWLREYYAADPAHRAAYLSSHPEFKAWLRANSDGKDFERLAILQAYRSIPKGEAWLRRVFRERYPEIFSQEAIGNRKLRSVYDSLVSHPDILPGFEKWVETIWATYTENIRLGTPRPLSSYFERDYEAERRYRSRFASRSAAETSR